MLPPRLTIFLLFLSLFTHVRGEDWPQFRGPRRDGSWQETGLATSFPKEGLKVKWRQACSYGWSSPSIARGLLVFTETTYSEKTATEHVRCLRAADGAAQWEIAKVAPYPEWAFTPDQLPGPTASPLIDDGVVYTVGAMGWLSCAELATGAVRWTRDLHADYASPEMQPRASPLIDGDLLFISVGSRPGATIVAFDKHTGVEKWRALDETQSNSSPIIISFDGKRQLILWTGDSVSSLDPATGQLWWRQAMTTSGNDDNAMPVFVGDYLLISGLMFQLIAGQPEPEIRWPASLVATKRVLSSTSTAIIRGEYVYSANTRGELVCLSVATGKEVWKSGALTPPGSGAAVQIVTCGERAYLFTDEGNLLLADLLPSGFREISRAHLVDPVYALGRRKYAWAVPSFADRHIFARTERELVCASLTAE